MRISAHGLAVIGREEGRVEHVYLDHKGNPTVGVGHLCVPQGQFGPVGTPVSSATVDALLRADLATIEAAIAHWIPGVRTQNQYDALCCWLINVGPGFANPALHDLPRLVNAGDIVGAAGTRDHPGGAFAEYDAAGGVHDMILHARRIREAALFLTPDGEMAPTHPALVVAQDTRGVQHCLNLAGASPQLAEDGAFGVKTLAAVKAFQAAHGLSVDGIVGTATWAALTAAASGQ